MYRHLVLFKVRDDVPEAIVDQGIRLLESLSSIFGVCDWRVARSLDTRKGRVIIQDATFVDDSAFEFFRAHPLHQEAASFLAEIADWLVGDYVAPTAQSASVPLPLLITRRDPFDA